MAGPTRLELATSGVTGRRSNQLNYDPARSAHNRRTEEGLYRIPALPGETVGTVQVAEARVEDGRDLEPVLPPGGGARKPPLTLARTRPERPESRLSIGRRGSRPPTTPDCPQRSRTTRSAAPLPSRVATEDGREAARETARGTRAARGRRRPAAVCYRVGQVVGAGLRSSASEALDTVHICTVGLQLYTRRSLSKGGVQWRPE